MLEFIALAQECAPTVETRTLSAVVEVESSFNPYAIGVVGGRLERQPTSIKEAVSTATHLKNNGWNFSVGLAQVNLNNIEKYGLSLREAFEPCNNLRTGSDILNECYKRALLKSSGDEQSALKLSFSCYYSGNFKRGFVKEGAEKKSYVDKVLVALENFQPKFVQGGRAVNKPAIPPISVIPDTHLKVADSYSFIGESPVLIEQLPVSNSTNIEKEKKKKGQENSAIVF